jgi:hypothetical protein
MIKKMSDVVYISNAFYNGNNDDQEGILTLLLTSTLAPPSIP